MVAINSFSPGVQHAKCAALFHRNRLVTLIELSERVGKYIDTKEFLKSKGLGFVDNESTKAKRKYKGLDRNRGKKPKQGQLEITRDQILVTFTPLTRPIQEIMVVAEAQNLLKKRGKMKSPSEKRNRDKYC